MARVTVRDLSICLIRHWNQLICDVAGSGAGGVPSKSAGNPEWTSISCVLTHAGKCVGDQCASTNLDMPAVCLGSFCSQTEGGNFLFLDIFPERREQANQQFSRNVTKNSLSHRFYTPFSRKSSNTCFPICCTHVSYDHVSLIVEISV